MELKEKQIIDIKPSKYSLLSYGKSRALSGHMLWETNYGDLVWSQNGVQWIGANGVRICPSLTTYPVTCIGLKIRQLVVKAPDGLTEVLPVNIYDNIYVDDEEKQRRQPKDPRYVEKSV